MAEKRVIFDSMSRVVVFHGFQYPHVIPLFQPRLSVEATTRNVKEWGVGEEGGKRVLEFPVTYPLISLQFGQLSKMNVK